MGTSNLKVTINSGLPLFTILLYSPSGVLLQTATTNSFSYTFSNLPQLAAPLKYKIVLTDQCGNKDSVNIAPVISVADRAITVKPKCPSGIWPNGSADVVVDISNNNIGGNITPKIIKKDGAPISINASLVSGYKYTFLDLGPATYVFDTYIEDCNKHLYDTVTVNIYLFPVLSGSNAYQCDNNGFSVNVNVAGGVGPYTYEIIGSVPAFPSIVTAPQTSPVFTVNNGTVYSLIRLRVVDVCGNASLYDLSVLPLANFLVFADSMECFGHSLTLRVDSVAGAQYTWYKRIVPNDSVVVSTGPSLYFPNLSIGDTGRYFCKIVINNGCLIRYANYTLTGFCMVLPIDVTLQGTKLPGGNKLAWGNGGVNIRQYDLQRSVTNIADFKTISSSGTNGDLSTSFVDKTPFAGDNYYRLKLTTIENRIKYSNIILIRNGALDVSVYPNPVQNTLFIAVKNSAPKNYLVEVRSAVGQKISSNVYNNVQNLVIEYSRKPGMLGGMYLLTISDMQSGEKKTYKLVYK